jgi:TRAP-type C4-dicarboxylate transport system permease large subunit
MMEVAAVTPPVGLNLYAVKAALPEIPLDTIYKGSTPYWIMNVIAVFILYFFPQIALYLPGKM